MNISRLIVLFAAITFAAGNIYPIELKAPQNKPGFVSGVVAPKYNKFNRIQVQIANLEKNDPVIKRLREQINDLENNPAVKRYKELQKEYGSELLKRVDFSASK